jgi:pimeloyl-ACP methyl ester carboxylesterase
MPLIQVPRGNLHYETHGKGRSLALLHGMWSHRGMWKNVIPGLSADRFLVAPDYIGHGESDRMRHPCRLQDYATDINILFESMGIEDVTLIGFSMGSLISQEYYRRYPSRVRALVLIATPPPYKLRWRLAMALVSLLERLGITSLKKETIKSITRRFSKGTDRSFIDKSLKELTAYDDREFGLILRSVWEQPSADRAATIQVPTLLVVGEKDGIRGHSEALHRAIPHSRLQIVPESNHSVIFDNPKYLTELILEFLSVHK